MIAEILKDISMDNDFESDWFPIIIQGSTKSGDYGISIELYWKDATGILNGTVNFLVSNNLESQSLAGRYLINECSNVIDSEMIIIYPSFQFMKLKYTKNGITGGKLNAILSYGL